MPIGIVLRARLGNWRGRAQRARSVSICSSPASAASSSCSLAL